MRRECSLHVEALEGRKLPSTAHPAAAHPATGVVATPLVLEGKLAVDAKDRTATTNDGGSMTTSSPVSGNLAGLGKVHGTWYESTDAFGDYQGPDYLQIQVSKPKGSLTVSFNNQDTGKVQAIGGGLGIYQHAQRLDSSSGAFAKATENGSIELIVNSAKKSVQTLELLTPTS